MCGEHDHGPHEVAGLEERLAELQAAVEALQARVRAEQAVSQAVADGHATLRAITTVLRRRADEFSRNVRTRYLAELLREVADEIEGEARLT